jgi:hypothetical protein
MTQYGWFPDGYVVSGYWAAGWWPTWAVVVYMGPVITLLSTISMIEAMDSTISMVVLLNSIVNEE